MAKPRGHRNSAPRQGWQELGAQHRAPPHPAPTSPSRPRSRHPPGCPPRPPHAPAPRRCPCPHPARAAAGSFWKIKAISLPTCSSFSRQGQPARGTIPQLVHASSSSLASYYGELRFGSCCFFGCEGYEKHSRIQTWQGRGGQVKFSLNRQNLQYSGRVPQHPGRGKARPRLSRQRRAQTPDFNIKTHPAHPGTQPPSATTRWLHGPILQRLHNPSSTSPQRVPANAGICCHTRVFCRKAAAPRGSRTHHEALAAPRPWGPQSQPHAGCHYLHAAPEPGPGAAAVRGKRLPLGADHSGSIYRAIYTYP